MMQWEEEETDGDPRGQEILEALAALSNNAVISILHDDSPITTANLLAHIIMEYLHNELDEFTDIEETFNGVFNEGAARRLKALAAALGFDWLGALTFATEFMNTHTNH